MHRIAKWMAPGDSAHQIGIAYNSLGLADCSETISMVRIMLLWDSETQKSETFLIPGPQLCIAWPNGWFQVIHCVK